ncbi:MAG: M1 family metallopeptidase, partial [Pedobacter sp.]|nr:M1 family metallopeptidase [Pedobacter sp.]
DYELKVDFSPASRVIKGTVDVVYKNNSPDVLHEIWFKLYPNLYKKGTPRVSKIAESDLNDGVKITGITVNDKTVTEGSWVIDGTNMHMPVAALTSGKSIKLRLTYEYVLNEGSHVRTGQVDKGSYFVAYFFPRIAVYDDVDGWNKYPYLGDAEFYNDFCNFKAEITVPKGYVLWATGDLLNAKTVLNKTIAERITLAEQVDSVVNVITDADLKNQDITKDQPFNTWKFDARNVSDFVFATSNHYLWKSTSLVVDPKTKRRTRVDAAFNPKHKDYYEVIDFARKSVHSMSYDFPKWPFPYAHETVFDGLDQMEYPMMVNDNPVDKRDDAITLTVHEIFHTMFPFYMGINETKYGWMDEGWATIGEWLNSPLIDTTMVDEYGVQPTASSSGSKNDTPIMTFTPDLKGSGSFTNSYPKPALGYLFVKDYLGDELFTTALHHYIETWKGKHPVPYDFFYSMNEGSGKNMDWFWKRWFFEEGVTDMGIVAVDAVADGYSVKIENKSNKPMPIYLTLNYNDGSTAQLHETIGVWEKGNKQISVAVKTTKKLKKVILGGTYVPDRNTADNSFSVK